MSSDFKKLMSARFLFTFAVQMQAILIGWRMYELTHDPLQLGFIGLAEAIPALSLALFAGYLVDRSRPLMVYRCVLTRIDIREKAGNWLFTAVTGFGLCILVYAFWFLLSVETSHSRSSLWL